MKILELFREGVERHPGRAAVEAAGRTRTYGETEDASNRLAGFLLRAGAAGGDVAAILARDAFDVITALLACAKAGCAFMPLDPAAPGRRLRALISEAEPTFLLAGAESADLAGAVWEGFGPAERRVALDAHFPDVPPVRSPLGPGDLFYVYFTSGSTGRPKGIAGQAKSVDHFVRWEIETFGVGEGTRVSQLTSPAFDAYLRDVLTPLAAGGTVCVPDGPEILADPRRLADWLDESRVGVVHCVPTLFRSLLAAPLAPERFAGLRYVLLAGEPLLPADVGRWHDVFGDRVRLVNLYGPSETTMVKLFHLVRPADRHLKSIPIGRPMKGAAALVVNSRGAPCGPGEIGEIYLRTPFRSLGYYRRPDLTREAFIPNPFRDDPEDLVYKTGDLGRALEDGTFEFLGRRDQQVKIGGVRVEMGEIEGVLGAHPAVAEAAVVDRRDAAGAAFLCAYYVAGSEVAPAALREYLAERLPAAMVPSAFRPLEGLPRQITGKLDRRALKSLREDFAELRREYLAPRDEVEELVAGLFAEALGGERVGVHDDFFAAGGQSLAATLLLARIRERFGVELSLKALFASPTVADVAARLEELLRGAEAAAPPIEPRAAGAGEDLPLSLAQTRLWVLDQLDPGNALYNMPAALRARGELDLGVLEAAFRELTRRHEVLRTTFASAGGRPAQRLHPPPEARLPLVDLSALPGSAGQRQLRRWIAEEFRRPFDLERGPLLRTGVARLGERDHAILVTFHHIVCDAWSLGVAVGEIAALYEAGREGRPSPLPPLRIQYADYARWQNERLPAWIDGELAYWRGRLEGGPAPLELPFDRPRPAVPGFRGEARPLRISPSTAAALTHLARRRNVTLFMLLLASYEALLHRHTHQDDLAVGSPVAGRLPPETRGLIGFFVNTLVLSTDLSGDPRFADLLGRVRETVLGAYAHQRLPFERLVEELQPARDLSHSPLFQVLFGFDNTPWELPALAGLEWRRVRAHGNAARFDLTLVLEARGDAIAGAMEYGTELFDATTVERLARRFQSLTADVLARPERRLSELGLLSAAERQQSLVEWNDTESGAEAVRGHEALADWARRTPDAVALEMAERRLSYAGLASRVVRLVRRLREAGVGPEKIVGVCARRSPELVTGLLGVVAAGGAYLPLDPGYPRRRLAFMVSDSGARWTLAGAGSACRLPRASCEPMPLEALAAGASGRDAEWPASRLAPDHPAYVIYTSGSTGVPKGVVVTHRGLANLVHALGRAFSLDRTSRVLQFASPSFDASVPDVFATLGAGGTIVLGDERSLAPGPELAALAARSAATDATLPPSVLAALDPSDFPSLATLVAAGETCGEEVARRWAAGRVFLNAYGPTENTVCTTVGTWRGGKPAIGLPVANVRVHLLDRRLRPVPAGVAGELCTAGAGVARGYLARPARSADRFVPDAASEAPGGRLYLTGDLARRLSDGRLDFLGRRDTQLKVRGYRVEPGEIESALLAHSAVREAAVVSDSGDGGRLAACLVARPGAAIEPAVLRKALADRLPRPFVPGLWIVLEALPRTPGGKVDRTELGRRAAAAGEARGVSGTAPRTPLEGLVAGIWGEVLGSRPSSMDDDFFEAGGHSLLATRLISRIRRAFGVDLGVRAVFERPTVAALAAEIERTRRRGLLAPDVPIERVSRDRPLPLSFAQQRLWFLYRLDPASTAYNVPGAVRLLGALRPEALAGALDEIVRRHESLRTRFTTVDDEPAQVVAPASPVVLSWVDLVPLPFRHRETEARRLADAEAALPFDLVRGPLLRCRLLRLGVEDHVLLVTQHHIVSDGWSMGVLIHELTVLYGAAAVSEPAFPRSPLPELAIQYADYAAWQRKGLTEDVQKELLSYWRKRLSGLGEATALPPDPTRPKDRGAGTVDFRLDRKRTEALARLARKNDATLFMALVAAFAVALHQRSGLRSLVLATDVANRGRTETEQLIGIFVNQLLLRLDLDGDPAFTEVLERTRREALDAYHHQDLPFDRLVSALAPERDPDRRSSLFQVKFVLQEPLPELGSVAGLTVASFEAGRESTKFDLLVNLVPTERGLRGRFDYAAELFEASTIERLCRSFATVLRRVPERPETTLGELAAELAEVDRRLAEERDRELEQARRKTFERACRKAVSADVTE